MSSFEEAREMIGRVADEIGCRELGRLALVGEDTVRAWQNRGFWASQLDTFVALLKAAQDHESGRRRGKRGEPGRPPKEPRLETY
jgi:hypothetical protein